MIRFSKMPTREKVANFAIIAVTAFILLACESPQRQPRYYDFEGTLEMLPRTFDDDTVKGFHKNVTGRKFSPLISKGRNAYSDEKLDSSEWYQDTTIAFSGVTSHSLFFHLLNFRNVNFIRDTIFESHFTPSITFNGTSPKSARVFFDHCTIPNGLVAAPFDYVHFNDCVANRLDFDGRSTQIVIKYSKVKSIYFLNADIGEFIVDASSVDNIRFIQSVIRDKDLLIMRNLPRKISLEKVDLSRLKEPLEISELIPDGRRTDIFLEDIIGIENLRINYTDELQITFPDNYLFEDKSIIYTKLLDSHRQQKDDWTYERLDKEYKRLKHFRDPIFGLILNTLDKYWWDYGYNDFLIIPNTGILIFFFFTINSILYTILVNEVYPLKNFAVMNQLARSRYFRRPLMRYITQIPHMVLYTLYIFWGLRLEVKAISIDRLGLFYYILLQYALGLICLAHITNLIINR